MAAFEDFEAMQDEDPETSIRGLQALVNSGAAWRLEGAVGREAMRAIDDGLVVLGHEGHRDAYGNYVPSRTEVEPGTVGSVEYATNLTGRTEFE